MDGESTIHQIIEISEKEECGWIIYPNIFYIKNTYIKEMTDKYNQIKHEDSFHRISDIRNSIKNFKFVIYYRNEEYIIYGKNNDIEKRKIIENVFKRYSTKNPTIKIINKLIQHFLVFDLELLEGINNLLILKYD